MSPHRARWDGPRDGPWPSVQVDGELERAEREWLHTNGTGAYAMSTLALMHTRRHHGLLVAALDPPIGRYVVLSHAETAVTTGERTYRLATHQFPGVAPTLGYRNLRLFAQDPLPRWVYRLGKGLLERTLALVRGANAVVLRYRWLGRVPARISLMPLMPLRPVEHLAREHGGMQQKVSLRPNEVAIQPLASLPPVVFAHRGCFMGSPDWWRRFEYNEDLRRYSDFQEDIWTPGTFEFGVEPESESYLVVAVGALPPGTAEEMMQHAADYLLEQDLGPARSGVVRTLHLAADSFCATDIPRPSVVAGYPWLGAPLRDWLISMPTLLVGRGRIAEAKRSLAFVLDLMRGGLLPSELSDRTPRRIFRSVDATLWLFEAARELCKVLPPDDDFVSGPLLAGLTRAFLRLRRRRRQGTWVTPEGLLAAITPGLPSTWMDATVKGAAVTPRSGLAVEHQALWFNACRTIAELAERHGKPSVATAARDAERAVLRAFRSHFWCNETDYPFDCISAERETANAWADPTQRPNAVIALALAPELFDAWQENAILRYCQSDLLTPRGLRTLPPSDGKYIGHYEGSLDERDGALHQGTVWPFLLGFYARARVRQNPGDEDVRAELTGLVQTAASDGIVLGHVAQIADGEEPHRQRGCPAQAWSVALLLGALTTDLGVD